MNLPPAGTHTCYNCFAEFEWTPFTSDGENFCCAGCADGGPCVCTYTGAPHVTAPAGAGATGEPDPGDVGLPAAESPGGPGPDDGEGGDGEPPAPGQTPDEEPPANGRLAIIMAAVSEMPLPVQEVVRARLATAGSEDQVGEPLGLTGEEVRQLLRQGQAILDRSLGPGFTIRHIAAEQMSNGEEPEQAFPPFEQVGEQAGPGANPRPGPATGEQPTDLGMLIARSVDSMTRATGGDGPEHEAARDLLAEALREAGNLFRLA
ncbi:MAG: hypothetical protein O3B04_07605 [Chloroflexi bacterium]|nr:hypothetical protein [Chloroflexota bacterium]